MSQHDEPSGLTEAYEHLKVDDPERFMHTIYHELRRVYRANAGRHDESLGDDTSTFGFCVYRNSWFAVEQALAGFGSGVETSRPDNSLVISTPGPKLKLYRGGADETFDIESYDTASGSDTKQRFTSRNQEQLVLFELAADERIGVQGPKDLDHWMIVHSGSPETGLKHVWVGAPRSPTIDNPSPWAFVVHIPDLCAQRDCSHGDKRTEAVVEPAPAADVRQPHDQLDEPELIIERLTASDDQ